MTGSLIPLDIPGGHGPHWAGGPPPFVPFLGVAMFLLVLLITAGVLFFLARTGRIGPPPWVAASRAPETEAKKILADRFANGDISAEEFMERASVLNWTPGSEAYPKPNKRR